MRNTFRIVSLALVGGLASQVLADLSSDPYMTDELRSTTYDESGLDPEDDLYAEHGSLGPAATVRGALVGMDLHAYARETGYRVEELKSTYGGHTVPVGYPMCTYNTCSVRTRVTSIWATVFTETG